MGTVNERRGRFNAASSIHERTASAKHRHRFGHWEGDTVRGKVRRSALVSLIDRKSRFLFCQRVAKANADSVKDVRIDCLSELPSNRVRNITPDRGSEFAKMFFPDAHSPQQRGTNENTNCLIRTYFPTGTDLNLMSDEDITAFVHQLNN